VKNSSLPRPSRLSPVRRAAAVAAAILLITACSAPAPAASGPVSVTITADGTTRELAASGPTVREALVQAGITLGPEDRVQPPDFTQVSPGLAIRVVRVTEELIIEETVLPFERQTVRNESVPEGETRLLQIGVNGVQETTIRVVYEDGVQVSRNVIKQQVVTEPVAEIVMIGAQASFVSVPVRGSLAYLAAGNAWLMQGSSAARRPLTLSSDLDGRVFSLSPDGSMLLFTRVVSGTGESEAFNTLWLVDAREEEPEPVDLQIANVLWADWAPQTGPQPGQGETRSFAYSTAEPRATAPGWQANNDVTLADVNARGRIRAERSVLETSSGGVYGWWGMSFAWAPDGRSLAYAQADTVGTLTVSTEVTPTLKPLVTFPLYQTYSDWVWTPALAWSQDSRFLYTVMHGQPVRFEKPEDSPAFDVAALALAGETAVSAPLVRQSGMWAAPAPAPGGGLVAYLQAIEPLESVASRYVLHVMDADGSNSRRLFPPEGEMGLNPQTVAWSPDSRALAVIRAGDLWLVDAATGEAQQLTADGQASKPSWVAGTGD
jgi:hypothetical protein